ncbi:hypothetical protein D3C78_1571460 [compost metagenome]
MLFRNTYANGDHAVARFFGHGRAPSKWVLKRSNAGALRKQSRPSRLGGTLFVPLNFGYAIRGTGDTACYLLDMAALLEERFDLFAEAVVGSMGWAGVCLVHAGYSVMSH